jgi:hypothetical protein
MRAKLTAAFLLSALAAGGVSAQEFLPFAAAAIPATGGYAAGLYPIQVEETSKEYLNGTQLEFSAIMEGLPTRIGAHLSELLDSELGQALQEHEAGPARAGESASTN